MSKSIVIIGKGPSVKRCKREFVESFDEVAICGRPVFDGYEEFIGLRAHWDFSNQCAKKYPAELHEKLGIIEWIDTDSESPHMKTFTEEYADWFEFGPSTGTFAFDWFVKKPEYDTIALVGFDLFPKGKCLYYFKKEENNHPIMSQLYTNGTMSEDGILLRDSAHNTNITHKYMCEMFDIYKNKKFYIITDYPFEETDNLTIM